MTRYGRLARRNQEGSRRGCACFHCTTQNHQRHCPVAANKAQKKDDKARERLEKRDAVAAAKLAACLEKERLRAAKKLGTQRKAAAKKAGKDKAAGRGRKVVEDTETDGEEFSSVDSSGYSNATDTLPPAALAAQLPRFP